MSETNGMRLLQGYIKYRDANGVTKTGRVATVKRMFLFTSC